MYHFRPGSFCTIEINHYFTVNTNHCCTADQASTQSPQLSPSAVSRKDVGNANQNNVAQAGLRGPASSDAIRPSEQIQEFSPDAYLAKSAEPLLPMTGRTLVIVFLAHKVADKNSLRNQAEQHKREWRIEELTSSESYQSLIIELITVQG